jgi:hypothetical protein
MIDLKFRPLDEWTEPGKLAKVRPQFRSTYQRTLDLLEFELKKIHATDIVIEAGYARQDIRNDGWPRNGARPRHPGTILYFRTTDGDMRFPCGTYKTCEANLHAIALTLENLRAIDRYGATLGHQQYLGFKALPAAGAAAKQWSVDEAAAWLSENPGNGHHTPVQIVTNVEAYRQAYRSCAAALHPDRGGKPEAWNELQTVKAVLDSWHESHSMVPRAAR